MLFELFLGLTHREPLVDEEDLERFVKTVEPLMQRVRDALWILLGRSHRPWSR